MGFRRDKSEPCRKRFAAAGRAGRGARPTPMIEANSFSNGMAYSDAHEPLPIATGGTGLLGRDGLILDSAGIANAIMIAKPSP